jgi:hypothetical protein
MIAQLMQAKLPVLLLSRINPLLHKWRMRGWKKRLL